MSIPIYLEILQNDFNKRKEKNPRFSLRSYSRLLGVNPGNLSAVLNGKRRLSLGMGIKISSSLNLEPNMAKAFIKSIESNLSKIERERLRDSSYAEYSIEMFSPISDWKYFAIMNTVLLDKYDGTINFIVNELAFSKEEVEKIVSMLVQAKIFKIENGIISRVEKKISVQKVSSDVIKSFHSQNLNLAIDSLFSTDVNDRDMSSITMAISMDKLENAKIMIKNFRRKLSAFLTSDEKDAVYNFSIQLFPIRSTKKEIYESSTLNN